MATPTAPTPTDLAQEVERLKANLAAAQLQRISPADRLVIELQRRLADKEYELRQREEVEATAAAEQQRSLDFQTLAQLERDIDRAKLETVTLRSMIVELPQKLSQAQWHLSQLLKQHASLKLDLGMKG